MATDSNVKIVISAVDQTKAALESVQNNLGTLTANAETVKNALAGIGVGLSVAGLAEMVKGTINAADEMNDLSQRVGIGVQELGKYELASRQSGASLESVAKGIKAISVNMAEHGAELKKAGLIAKDADGQLREYADLFAKMPYGMEKTALAVKAFGKEGMALIPMLNQGSKGLEEAAEKSAKYAAVMAEMAPKADEFNDRLVELAMYSKVAGMSMVNDLLPGLSEIAAALALAAKEGGFWKATWIALGALGTAMFTDDFLSQLAKVDKQIAKIKSDMEGYNPLSIFGDSMEKMRTQLAALEAERARIEKEMSAEEKKKKPKDMAADVRKQYEDIMKALGVGEKAAGVDPYDALAERVDRYNDQLALQARLGRQVTEGEKLEIEIREKLGASIGKEMTAALAWTKAKEYELATRKELAKIMDDVAKGYAATVEDMNKETQGILDETEKIRDHNTELIYGTAALEARKEARLDATIADKEAELQSLADIDRESEYAKALRASIAALQDKKRALGESVTANEIHKQQEEWKKLTDSIENSLTDALMRGFENGKGFGQNFVDSLKNSLKTAALKITVQAIVNPVMNTVGSALGIQGLTGSTSGFGNLLSAGNGVNALLGSGSMLGGFGTGFSAMTAEMAAGANFVGPSVALANGSIGAGASVASALGPTAAGALSSVATAMPYIAAAYLVADAAGLFGKRGGPQSGQYGTITADKGYQSSYTMSGGDNLGNAALTQSAYAQALSLFKMAGKDAAGLSLGTGYKLDPNGSGPGLAYKDIYLNGKIISGGGGIMSPGWTGSSSDAQGAASYLGKLSTDEILKLTDAIGDPQFSATVAKLAANFTDLNEGITKYATAMALRDSLDSKLMTDQERLAASTQNMEAQFAAMGIAVPKSATEFRDLVKSIDLTTQAGQNQIATLGNLSDAFVQANAAMQATEQTRNMWQSKLDIMQGKYTQTQLDRFFQLIGTEDEATKAIMKQVFALEDQTAAAKSASDALKKMTDYAKNLKDAVDQMSLGDLSPLTNGQKLAAAQSTYTITLAQAQAGDATAQNAIISAAQTLLSQAHEYYASSATYTQLFNQITTQLNQLASLAGSGKLPSFDVGTNRLPSDMVAKVHADERIMPAADNRELMRRLAAPEQNAAALAAEVRALREEVSRLRADNARDAGMLAQTVDRASGENAERVAGAVERTAASAARKERGGLGLQ